MKSTRKLALRREIVAELSEADLRSVGAAGTRPDLSFSCLTYVSCYITDCLLSDEKTICLEG